MSEEQYRIALYEDVLLQFLDHICKNYINGYRKGTPPNLAADLTHYAGKCLEIERADFGDNFNPDHGEEQGKPF